MGIFDFGKKPDADEKLNPNKETPSKPVATDIHNSAPVTQKPEDPSVFHGASEIQKYDLGNYLKHDQGMRAHIYQLLELAHEAAGGTAIDAEIERLLKPLPDIITRSAIKTILTKEYWEGRHETAAHPGDINARKKREAEEKFYEQIFEGK